jgi:predicted Zn-dependent protease
MRIAPIALLACAVACGSGDKKHVQNPKPLPKPDAPKIELPNVAAVVETQRVEPMTGNDAKAASPVLAALAKENQRWADALDDKRFPAYFVAYQVLDRREVWLEAEEGSLLREDEREYRLLDVEVRVGSPKLDSRSSFKNDQLEGLDGLQREARITLGTDEKALRNAVWLETDRRYREATRRFKEVLTAESVKSSDRSQPPQFSHENKEEFVQAEQSMKIDEAYWIGRLKDCSSKSSRGIATRSTCSADFSETTVYYVNSEGTRLQQSFTTARFTVQVGVKADDGMPLGRVETRYARSPDGLPDDDEVEEMIERVNTDLDGLHAAPIVDPYGGPAILQGRAAAVFFHEVFGHRIEGHRQKDETSGQTFSSKLEKQIMPEWLTVYDDPTITTLNGVYLNGHYRFDDEGVRAQRASLVEDGVLKGFVLGRNPLDEFPKSNGHGRHEPGLWSVSRQGNLVVEASRSVPDDELKKLLIAEVKRQNKPYGMMFTDISGGFTNTSRFLPQSFKVNPIMAYRIYPDGREELVRGVDIEGTPLIALGSIAAAGRSVEVFNGMCGAESGWVPVSASAPSLLLSQLEVARTTAPSGSSPILDAPSIGEHR